MFDAYPNLENEFVIAHELHMTVAELRHGRGVEMSNLEWIQWEIYFGRIHQRMELEKGSHK